jgi:hypothetical protein
VCLCGSIAARPTPRKRGVGPGECGAAGHEALPDAVSRPRAPSRTPSSTPLNVLRVGGRGAHAAGVGAPHGAARRGHSPVPPHADVRLRRGLKSPALPWCRAYRTRTGIRRCRWRTRHWPGRTVLVTDGASRPLAGTRQPPVVREWPAAARGARPTSRPRRGASVFRRR